MSWVGKTTPSRIDELTNELRYVREYISQLPSNIGSIGADNAGFGRRSASNSVGPVKGIWSFHPIQTRRYHEETLSQFLGETVKPIFLNALEVRAASQIVRPNTSESLMAIRQLVQAANDGQILFLTAHDDEKLRLMPGNLNTNGVLVIKDVAVDFVPDEVVTGLTSGATCEVDFIQNDNEPTPLPAGEKKVWFRNLSGSFQSNEDISGSIAGSAKAKNPQTKDTSGNINIAENVDIDENIELLLKWNANAPIPTSPEGSWIIIGGGDITVIGGGGGLGFPILYPTDDKGDRDGTSTLAIDLSVATAHVTRLKLVGGTPITQLISFTNPPTVGESIAFYITVQQDSNGLHTLDFSDTINNIPLIQTGPDKITNIGFITTDGGATYDTFVFGQTLGDNLGNHEATEDLKMNTFNVIDVDVLRYADPTLPGADGVIGFGVFGSSTDESPAFVHDAGVLPAGEVLKWNIPESEAGIPRRYQWEVDLEPVMALKISTNRASIGLDMLGKGTIDNTLGISFKQFEIGPGTAISSIRPQGLEMAYETGFGSGVGAFHGFRVGIPVFPQFEVREDVLRANVNVDMITNNIFDVDVVQWASTGGFLAGQDHGIRSIGGGNTGLEFNVPSLKTYRLLFENLAQDDSDVQYEFTENKMFFNNNQIDEILGIRFTNGVFLADIFTEFDFIGGRQGTVPNAEPQPITFKSQELVGFDSYVTRDIFTIDAREFFGGGGMKMHTDLNLQTQNINNVDVLKFIPDGGVITGNEFAMAADFSGEKFNMNIPPGIGHEYAWFIDADSIATLRAEGLFLIPNAQNLNASQNPGFFGFEFFLTGVHTGGSPFVDGQIRLIDNGGPGLDIEVGTGGGVVNLSNLGAGIGHIIQDEGVAENQRPNLNFIGTGVDVTDDPGNDRTNVTITGGVGGGATQLNELSDVTITLPQAPFEGLFFDTGTSQYRNLKITNDMLDPGVFSQIEGIGVQTQDLDMGGFNILNSPLGTSFIGFDADDNLRMNNFDILQVKNIDFDAVGSNIQGIFAVNFFHNNNAIVSTPNDLVYESGNSHLFESAGLQHLRLQGGSVQPIELRFNQQRTRVSNTNQIFLDSFGLSFGVPSIGNFTWYGGSSALATLFDTGSGGSFSTNFVNVNDSLFFSDSGPSQSLGLMSRDGDDITVLTSNGLKNFKDIGSGGGVDLLPLDNTWTGSNTYTQPIQGGSGLRIDGSTGAIHEFRFGGTDKFLFTNIAALFNEQLSMGFNKIINLAEPTVASDAATKNYVDIQGSGVTEGQATVNWTGNHTFNGTFTTIGNSTSDVLTVNSRVNGGFIPISAGFALGDTVRTWNVFANNFRFGGGHIVDAISNSSGAFGSTQLMTAQAIQLAISAGGGGVTEGQAFVNWTGTHTFNGSFMTIGNSTSDTVTVTSRINSSLIPTGSSFDLGDASRQWRNLWVTGTGEIDTLHLASGSFVSDIANFSTAFGSASLMTANAIQQAISNVGTPANMVTTNTTQTITGTKTFTSASSRFSSNLRIDGNIDHNGSRVGFMGATPQTRGTANFTGSSLSATIAWVADIARAMERLGLMNTNV